MSVRQADVGREKATTEVTNRRALTWDEFEIEWIQLVHQIDNSGTTFSDEPNNAYGEIEPIGGGVARDEVAELVELRPMALATTVEGGDNGAEVGRLNMREEWSYQETGEMYGGGDAAFGDFNDPGNLAEPHDIDQITDEDIFFMQLYNVYSPGAGSGGPGGGGGPQHNSLEAIRMRYRHDYGRGPLFTATDEYHIHGGIHGDETDSGNTNIEMFHTYMLVWDVFKVEDKFDEVPL